MMRNLAGLSISPAIDAASLIFLPFGYSSFRLQPWRGYLDTPSTNEIRNSFGCAINGVLPSQYNAAVRHLSEQGIKHLRVEVPWGRLDYFDPTTYNDIDNFNTLMTACAAYAVRPTLLLNANEGAPCPSIDGTIHVTGASIGATSVGFNALSITKGICGKTGINNLSAYRMAEVIILAVNGSTDDFEGVTSGTLTLSMPLPVDLPAGTYPISTLLYRPFSGSNSGAYTETINGWRAYIDTVIGMASASAVGASGFDLEVWNELSFASSFLVETVYFSAGSNKADIYALMLQKAIDAKAASGQTGIQIIDGFANTIPWPSPQHDPYTNTNNRTNFLSRHPYRNVISFAPNPSMPAYFAQAWLPEYYLTAFQTEFMRDMMPDVQVYGDGAHGRGVHHPSGSSSDTVPQVITEVNIDPGSLSSLYPTLALTRDIVERIRAKALLRYATFIHKGARRLIFYTAADSEPGGFGLIRQAFISAVDVAGGDYPVDMTVLISLPLSVLKRFIDKFPVNTQTTSKPLQLLSVSCDTQGKQFFGDGTPEYPDLTDLDMTAILPYQASDNKWIVVAYVMTINIARLYGNLTDAPYCFDKPGNNFRFSLSGITGISPTVTLYDPLNDAFVGATIKSYQGGILDIEAPLTDSPRIITITTS